MQLHTPQPLLLGPTASLASWDVEGQHHGPPTYEVLDENPWRPAPLTLHLAMKAAADCPQADRAP